MYQTTAMYGCDGWKASPDIAQWGSLNMAEDPCKLALELQPQLLGSACSRAWLERLEKEIQYERDPSTSLPEIMTWNGRVRGQLRKEVL